jgi:hypothetical protein
MSKILGIIITIFSVSASGSTFWAPDSDTAILLQILGEEAKSGVDLAQMLNVSTETMEKLQKYHSTVDDYYMRGLMAKNYAERVVTLPSRLKQVDSISTLRDNVAELKGDYDDKNKLTLGYRYLEEMEKETHKISKEGVKDEKSSKMLADNLLKEAAKAKNAGQGALLGGRSAAFSAGQLADLNGKINVLNLNVAARSKFLLDQEKRRLHEEYLMKLYFGMIPPSLTFKEYFALKGLVVINQKKKARKKRKYVKYGK